MFETAQEIGQTDQREALVKAETQHSLQRVSRAEALDHLPGRAEQTVGIFDERVAFGGEADPRAASDEQPRFQYRLQLPDALRHAGLSQAQLTGCRVKAAQTHDPLECS